MPRFNPVAGLNAARATIRVFPRGVYSLTITSANPFSYTRESDGTEIYGVRFGFTMNGEIDEEGNVVDRYAGESVSQHRIYLHSSAAMGMNKRFLMAAAGYDRNDEDAFDAEWLATMADELWIEGSGDDVECGSAYADLVGNDLRALLDIELDNEGGERQNFRAFYSA